MKQALQLGSLTAANIGLAFLFQWYVLTQLGPGMETDALFAGMTVPQLVLTVISGSLMHVLVPLLAGEPEERLHHDTWGFMVLIGYMFGVLAIVLLLLADWWVPLLVPGFTSEAQQLTVLLTRIQLVGMLLSAINGVQWAVYHARQKFLWPEIVPILSGVPGFILLIAVLPKYGVIGAAWINVLRLAIQTVMLMPEMGRPLRPQLSSPAISMAWRRIKPLLVGTLYYKTDPLIERFLLSSAASGSLSLYYLAQQIYGAGSQLLNKALAAPLVPKLSQHHKCGDFPQFTHAYRRRMLQVLVLASAIVLLIGFAGEPLLMLLVGYGNVSQGHIHELWWMLIWLSGMFLGGVAGQISSSTFYAAGDTATPTRVGIYTYTLYIPLKVLMYYLTGVKGLALATSGFYILNFLIQHYLLEKRQLSQSSGVDGND